MPESSRVRRFLKSVLPNRWRRFLRRTAREAPARLRDLPKDALCVVRPRAFGGPMPGPGLRTRVGGASREEFALVGREGSAAILRAFESARAPGRPYPAWLDFGCGCGRVASRLISAGPVERLSGVDVDAAQIRWARRHLRGSFSVMRPAPPLAFAPESFDVVYAISIFTHLDEAEQDGWLQEISRILTPGGLVIATTHGPELSRTCPGLTDENLASLETRGFLAVDPGGTFNERSSFHSRGYLEARWGRVLRPRLFEARGFVSYQDLSVWEKPAAQSR